MGVCIFSSIAQAGQITLRGKAGENLDNYGCSDGDDVVGDWRPLQMSCRSFREIIDAPQTDRLQRQAALDLIAQTFSDLDLSNAAGGIPQVYVPLNDHEKRTRTTMVVTRCGEHPTETLKQSTLTIYKNMQEADDFFNGQP